MARSKKREKIMDCCILLRLPAAQLQHLKEQAANSTCGSFSEFARRLLLRQKATILYRNHSLDSFIDEAILLRNEMVQIRSLSWTAENEPRIVALMESIQSIILKIYEQCKHK